MTDPKPKRRWYQFSLRTLLILVLLVSVGLSWFTVKLHQAKKQREAVEAILAAGGVVWYDYQTEGLDQSRASSWLRNSLGDDLFRDVARVILDSTYTGDAELEHLTGLTKLEGLRLGGTRITDAGLVRLTGLTRLKRLSLTRTQVTDPGLEHLKGLRSLRFLDVRETHLADTCVEKLEEALPNCTIHH